LMLVQLAPSPAIWVSVRRIKSSLVGWYSATGIFLEGKAESRAVATVWVRTGRKACNWLWPCGAPSATFLLSCTHTRARTHTRAHTHTRARTHTHACLHTHIYAHTRTHTTTIPTTICVSSLLL
jgi:hypothetical protein